MDRILFTVIIPQRNSTNTLPRLLSSIPQSDQIEVIIVDNTPSPIDKSQIVTEREFVLLWSPPEKHAGGARNMGITQAHGTWLIFADADDYFADHAFDNFHKYVDSDCDIVYFGSQGIYPETGELATRCDGYNKLLSSYANDEPYSEEGLRFKFGVPWAKMLNSKFVTTNNIWFDEVRAANDVMFSTKCGYYANKVTACQDMVYYATVNKGSLTRSRDLEVLKSRYIVNLRKNLFLKEHGLSSFQTSIMNTLIESSRHGIKTFFEFVFIAIKYRQNFLIGWQNWLNTYGHKIRLENKEKEYIVK